MSWIDGLANGLILPSDLPRLEGRDPRVARVVSAAWADLRSSGGASRLHVAVRWVDGLASGLILPWDIVSRLRGLDTAKAVAAAWEELQDLAS